MIRYALVIAAFVSAVAGCESVLGQMPDDRFRLTVGIGYDQITQGYYLSQTDTLAVDEDSLHYLRQASEELDDFHLKTRFEWFQPAPGGGRLVADNLTYLSDKNIRNSFILSFQSGPVSLENDLQARGVWDEGETSRKGYITNEITGRLKQELLHGFFFVIRNSFELVRYDGRSEYDFDYDYNKLSAGFEKEFGWTDLIALTYRNDRRMVSDSSRLDYAKHRAILELNWSVTFDLSVELESELTRIESGKENDLDDGWERLVEGEVGLYLGDRWRVGLRNLFEAVTYDSQDVVNFDYAYNTAGLSISYDFVSWLRLLVRPSALLFSSRYVEYEQQDYRQFASEYGFDIMSGDRLWFAASHRIGRRDYIREAGEFYTDYMLNQLNLTGDLKIYDDLRVNAILSIDWEDHDLESNDRSLLLLSIGMDYRF